MVTGFCIQPTIFAFNHHGLAPWGKVALLETVRPGQVVVVGHRRAGHGGTTRGRNLTLKRGLLENKTPNRAREYAKKNNVGCAIHDDFEKLSWSTESVHRNQCIQ